MVGRSSFPPADYLLYTSFSLLPSPLPFSPYLLPLPPLSLPRPLHSFLPLLPSTLSSSPLPLSSLHSSFFPSSLYPPLFLPLSSFLPSLLSENAGDSSSEDEARQEMVNISLYSGGPDITHTFPATEISDSREYHRSVGVWA